MFLKWRGKKWGERDSEEGWSREKVGKRLTIYNLSGVLSRKSLRGDSPLLDLWDSQSLRLQGCREAGRGWTAFLTGCGGCWCCWCGHSTLNVRDWTPGTWRMWSRCGLASSSKPPSWLERGHFFSDCLFISVVLSKDWNTVASPSFHSREEQALQIIGRRQGWSATGHVAVFPKTSK